MRAPNSTFVAAKALRRSMSLPEVLLWRDLRRRAAGLHVRRQHAVGPYVLDFYCSAAELAVEVDGSAHDHPDRVARDNSRDQWLSEKGIRVLRFNAADVLDAARRLDVIATVIAAAAEAPSTAFGGPPPPLRGGG